MPPEPPIVALLWDADGVLQHSRGGWRERLDTAGGPGFAEAVFTAEGPALRGEEPFADVLARLLRTWPADITVPELLGLWEDVDIDEAAVALVQRVRASGIRCFLATNQQDHRVRYMRTVLGYDEWFDGAFYSSELGAAKPSPDYFSRVLELLPTEGAERADPATVGFIDDSAANVESALALGLRAVRHDPARGVAGLADAVIRVTGADDRTQIPSS